MEGKTPLRLMSGASISSACSAGAFSMLLDSAPPGLDRLDSRVDDGVAGEKLRVLLAKDDVELRCACH